MVLLPWGGGTVKFNNWHQIGQRIEIQNLMFLGFKKKIARCHFVSFVSCPCVTRCGIGLQIDYVKSKFKSGDFNPS